MSIRVKKFDPSAMKPSRIIYAIGRRHSGKSSLIKDILSQMPRPDYVLAMAPTQSSLDTFREFLPECCIFEGFSQEKLEQTIATQKELLGRGKRRSVLIILDDCAFNNAMFKSTAQKNLHFNGRHLGIGLICSAQYMMALPPEMRTNIDYLFVMRDPVLANRQKLYKNFFGVFDNFSQFDQVMTTVTQNYGTLCLDGTVPSTSHADSVLWYRANTRVPPFRLCNDVYWKLSRRYERSVEELRRAQAKQFEMETADAADPRGKKVVVVQTEDEHGRIVSTSDA